MGFRLPLSRIVCWLLGAGAAGCILVATPLHAQDGVAATEAKPAPSLDPDLLAGIEDRAPVRNADENPFESQAYSYVLVQASKTTAASFARSARRDVTFAHLWEQPGDYRGQVVHVEGRLKRVRRFEAPRTAAADGVKVVYECWIFAEEYFSNPFCVLCTELPEGLRPAEKMEHQVAFDGWFFKRYRYKAGDGLREAPLLIGRSLIWRDAPVPEPAWSFSRQFLVLMVGFATGVVLLVVTVALWLRRGDRGVRARLAASGLTRFEEPRGQVGR